MRGIYNKITGQCGEDAAAEFLKKKKYKIIERNYKNKIGEIDIIARTKTDLVFVEVKARKAGSMISPRESVDEYKQKKIIKTAEAYIMKTDSEKQPRFDVFEVFLQNGRIYKFNHIESAFDAW